MRQSLHIGVAKEVRMLGQCFVNGLDRSSEEIDRRQFGHPVLHVIAELCRQSNERFDILDKRCDVANLRCAPAVDVNDIT